MEKETTKIDQLEALDSKVKTPALAAVSILGVIGALVMGAGMSNRLVIFFNQSHYIEWKPQIRNRVGMSQ